MFVISVIETETGDSDWSHLDIGDTQPGHREETLENGDVITGCPHKVENT